MGLGYKAVTGVRTLSDYCLLLTFEGSETRIFDCKTCFDLPIFHPLRDKNLFQTARVSFNSIAWANGADIAPETLYDESIPAAGAVANRITMSDSG